jgi:hypothetical protein
MINMSHAVLNNRHLLDLARGKLVTFDGFDDANPNNLANATDGNYSTATGTGTKVMTGAGSVGSFILDLGEIKTVLVTARVGIGTTAGNISVFIDSSDDGIAYRTFVGSGNYTTLTGDNIKPLVPALLNTRFIRLRVTASAAATCNANLRELMVFEV